jgi:phage-related protein
MHRVFYAGTRVEAISVLHAVDKKTERSVP